MSSSRRKLSVRVLPAVTVTARTPRADSRPLAPPPRVRAGGKHRRGRTVGVEVGELEAPLAPVEFLVGMAPCGIRSPASAIRAGDGEPDRGRSRRARAQEPT